MITQEQLKQLVSYDPDTGDFRWISTRPKTKRKIGHIATISRPDGYLFICIDYKLYRAHILAWLYMTGEWPSLSIDHKNLNKSDNSWGNLRLATATQNFANVPKTVRNRSGFKGVSRYRAGDKRGLPWQASIRKNRKSISLGHFATAEEAHAAYAAAAVRLFGEFARAA